MPETGLLGDLLVIFALGVVAVLAMHRVRLPSIVGFLAVGVLCGPFGLGLLRAVTEVQAVAEVGVILLLFTIGIQFSLDQLVQLRRTVLVGGGIQLTATIALVAVLARAVGLDWRLALFLGMLVAHSSSTIILRLLSDRGELDSLHARSALGVSLFQDLSVVPMVLALPLLTGLLY